MPKFFYIIPDFQNPAGATCSGVKRRRIAELADRHGFLIVEDAPYRLLRYRGQEEPTLYSIAPERTLHMSSFTKLIAPGVEHGFMIGEPTLIAKLGEDGGGHLHLARLRGAGDHVRMVPPRPADAANRTAEGALRSAPRRLPRRHRQRTCRTRSPPVPMAGSSSRSRCRKASTPAVRAEAAKRGLNLADGLAFFPNGGGERFIRLPFCALTPAEIDEGVRRLSESVAAVR